MRVSRSTLNGRLRRQVGRRISITAGEYAFEPGRLQRVCRNTWIRVEGQYFVSHSLDQIVLHQVSTSLRHTYRVSVRTTYRGTIEGHMVRIGLDYIEIIIIEHGSRLRMLIPLNKVISN